MTSAEPQPPTPIAPTPTPHRRHWYTIASIGIVALLSVCVILLLIDWRRGTQMARPWLQVLFAALGAALMISAILLRKSSRPRRVLLCLGGLLVLLAVYDSLDGQQDVLTEAVLLLALWGLMFGSTTAQLLRPGAPTTRRHRLAVAAGVLATLAYAGAAGYGVRMGLAGRPLTTLASPITGVGILLNVLLTRVGGIAPPAGPISGRVRVCPACGLPNIPERQTCKRCATGLDSSESVQ